MSVSSAAASPIVRELQGRVRGRVIHPGDAEFDAARRVAVPDVDRRPLAILRVAGPDDVAAGLHLARERALPLAVRSGGHSGVGHGVVDDGLVIDLRDLKRIEIDPATRTAWADAGLTAVEVTKAAAAHGLAIGFGDTGTVGIGGITVGGGIGFLVRKHGLTIDNLLAAEIVTPDGSVRVVDAEHEPDLFWAIRGGGGNFGVVTRFRFRLVELPSFVGGMLVQPATPGALAGFMAAAEAAPEELSTIANVMPCPPLPFVAPEHHGELVLFSFLAYAGDADAGQRALAPFRDLATPYADLTRPMAYSEMYPHDPEPADEEVAAEAGGEPGWTVAGRTMFLDHLDEAAAEDVISALEASDAALRAVQLRVLGGAVGRVPVEATAYAHRAAKIMSIVVASYAGPEDKPARQAWVDALARKLDQGVPGAYVNFLNADGEADVRAAYPGRTWDRLAEIKARVDPDNLLRMNYNIPPARA